MDVVQISEAVKSLLKQEETKFDVDMDSMDKEGLILRVSDLYKAYIETNDCVAAVRAYKGSLARRLIPTLVKLYPDVFIYLDSKRDVYTWLRVIFSGKARCGALPRLPREESNKLQEKIRKHYVKAGILAYGRDIFEGVQEYHRKGARTVEEVLAMQREECYFSGSEDIVLKKRNKTFSNSDDEQPTPVAFQQSDDCGVTDSPLQATPTHTRSTTNVITPKTSVVELVDLTNDIFEAEDQKLLSKYFSPLNNSQLDEKNERSGMICIPAKNVNAETLKYLMDKSVVYIMDKPASNPVTTPPTNLGDDGEVTRIKRRRLIDDVGALEAKDASPFTNMKSGSVEAVAMGMQQGVEEGSVGQVIALHLESPSFGRLD